MFGERLLSLYILDGKEKYPTNYKIDSLVGIGLSKGSSKFGGTTMKEFSSFLAVRKKGGMDTSLWEVVVTELILLVLRPTLALVKRPRVGISMRRHGEVRSLL